MRDHKKLRAFELADELAISVYKFTKKFPKDELYGLTSQMRRAAMSVPSNIVEGCSRESHLEYLRFIEFATGSFRELHYQFSLAKRLEYITESEIQPYEQKFVETGKVLTALIFALKKSNPKN